MAIWLFTWVRRRGRSRTSRKPSWNSPVPNRCSPAGESKGLSCNQVSPRLAPWRDPVCEYQRPQTKTSYRPLSVNCKAPLRRSTITSHLRGCITMMLAAFLVTLKAGIRRLLHENDTWRFQPCFAFAHRMRIAAAVSGRMESMQDGGRYLYSRWRLPEEVC